MNVEFFIAITAVIGAVAGATWKLSSVLNGIQEKMSEIHVKMSEIHVKMSEMELRINDRMDKKFDELKKGQDEMLKRIYHIEAILWAQKLHPDHKIGEERKVN